MSEIKVQRDTKIILSLTEEEAAHVLGLMLAAADPANEVLSEIETSLYDVLGFGEAQTAIPAYAIDENDGFFKVQP